MNDFDTWLVQYRRRERITRIGWSIVRWGLMILSATVFLVVAYALTVFAIVTFG